MQEMPADKPLGGTSDSLGATLRAAREACGLSVHKAAQDMHVSDDVVAALEHDDFASLGAPIFVRGHMRNYARLLGLAEEEVLSAEHTADKLAPPALITQQPGSLRTFGRRFAMPVFSVIVIVLLLVLGMLWWQHRPAEQSAMALVDHDMSATSKTVMLAPAAASNRPMAAAGSGVSKLEGAAKKPKEVPQHKLVVLPMSETKQNPGAKSTAESAMHVSRAQTALPSASTVSSAGLTHAQFNLSQPSWIEVYDASGKRLYYALAPAGNSLGVSGAGPLQVFLGNAPGVSIELNGKPFNLAPFTHPDNTARFRLGENPGNSGNAG